MRHLTPSDYRRMPWANGRGATVEMARADGPVGMLWRLSRAQVIEDGPFSIIPGVERNLTVISGPGFDLRGALALRADPLVPVAFPGDVALGAVGVTAACEDVNVMTDRALPRPSVTVTGPGDLPAGRGLLCLLALGAVTVNGHQMAAQDLMLDCGAVQITGEGLVLAIRLFV